jgi:hypothetical protein
MGLFDFFKRDKHQAAEEERFADKKVASLGKTCADKRAQSYDRDEAMRKLIELGTHEAAIALLKRFRLQVDPSITDQEEKQLAFDGIVSIGRGERGRRVSDAGKDNKDASNDPLTKAEKKELRDAVVDATRQYCVRAQNLTWPLKVLRALLEDEPYQSQLLELLSGFDTEYTRNVEPKINLLAAFEGLVSDEVRLAVEPYLDDVNETVRFHAVVTIYDQNDQASLEPLLAMLKNEESVRIKNKVAEGMRQLGWSVPDELRDELRDALRDAYEYTVTADGHIKKAS